MRASVLMILLLMVGLGSGPNMLQAADPLQIPVQTAVAGKIDWVFDYEKGKSLSQSTGKPMFVVFRCER